VIRTPADVLPDYAETFSGVWISSFTRDDGLRTGRAIIDYPDRPEYLTPTVGFVESATVAAHGIVAVLAILSKSMDADLRALADAGQLACAQICVLHRTSATPIVTGWGLCTWLVERAREAGTAHRLVSRTRTDAHPPTRAR